MADPRRRLEAEELRDSLLAVSGKLDRRMFGPGFKPFAFEDDHSPRYQYEKHDPDEPGSQRRSIYRFLVRSVPDPFMGALDCADDRPRYKRRPETLPGPATQISVVLNCDRVRGSEFGDASGCSEMRRMFRRVAE